MPLHRSHRQGQRRDHRVRAASNERGATIGGGAAARAEGRLCNHQALPKVPVTAPRGAAASRAGYECGSPDMAGPEHVSDPHCKVGHNGHPGHGGTGSSSGFKTRAQGSASRAAAKKAPGSMRSRGMGRNALLQYWGKATCEPSVWYIQRSSAKKKLCYKVGDVYGMLMMCCSACGMQLSNGSSFAQ